MAEKRVATVVAIELSVVVVVGRGDEVSLVSPVGVLV